MRLARCVALGMLWGAALLRGSVADAPKDMGIDWMTWDELREAIPPAYTEWIGRQLMAHLERAA